MSGETEGEIGTGVNQSYGSGYSWPDMVTDPDPGFSPVSFSQNTRIQNLFSSYGFGRF